MNRTLRRLLKFLLIIGVVVGLIWLIQQYGMERIRANVAYMGVWAPIGIFALRFISVVIPALPSTAWSLLAGSVLANFWTALFTVVLADVISCSLAFFLAKNLVEIWWKSLLELSLWIKLTKSANGIWRLTSFS